MTAGSVTTDYVWDARPELSVVLDDETYRYVYGLDLIAAVDGSDDAVYFSYDGLGSTSDVTDEAADVIATWSYDVFGAVRSSGGSTDQVWKFTGEQEDADTGLYFLRARYMDPETGRFISRDPWDSSDDEWGPPINLYTPGICEDPVTGDITIDLEW